MASKGTNPDRLILRWRECDVGSFDRLSSDVGYYSGTWTPFASRSTDEFNSLLVDLKGNSGPWKGILVHYRRDSSTRTQIGLIHEFGETRPDGEENFMRLMRLPIDKIIGLIQSQGIVTLAGDS